MLFSSLILKDKKFVWLGECEEFFLFLKIVLSNVFVLVYFLFIEIFIFDIDVLDDVIGVVLL